MEDLNDKITGGSVSAAEWNQLPSEIQNVIEALGVALSAGDLNQLGKGIAGYVANGNFYTDSGAADAYVLSVVGSKQAPPAYTDGMRVAFRAGNSNTGVTTVNVAGLGVKNIFFDGAALGGGEFISGNEITLSYDSANGRFNLENSGVQILTTQGAWTPTVQDSTFSDAEGQAYGVQQGSYTRIGNRVLVSGRVQLSSLGTLTSSDPLWIAGLPFPHEGPSSQGGVSVVDGGNLNIAAGVSVTGTITSGLDVVRMKKWGASLGTTDLLISEILASGILVFEGAYVAT